MAPRRIVSLVPSLTEAVARLGRGDDLVAVTDFCRHPEALVARKERIGGTKDPDLDRIEALGPDLVLANTDEQRAATLDELQARGLDVLVTETDSLEDVLHTWNRLGQTLDATENANAERARIEAERDANARSLEATDPLSVLVPVWRTPWMAAGPDTYVSDLLAHCGFENLLTTQEKWPRIVLSTDPDDGGHVEQGPAKGAIEHVLPHVPDVVLLPTEPYRFDERHRNAFRDLGVTRHRVRVVDGELLTWWLTGTAEALGHFRRLREALDGAVVR